MNLNLQHKIIIVTGGASGIGEGICKKLAAEGAIPCLLDRHADNMQRVADEIEQAYGLRPFTRETELTQNADCINAVASVLERFGRIDGLVNNAGLNDGVSLEHGSYEHFINSLDRNAAHYFSMTHEALPALQQSRGAIVNICSKTAVTGQGGTSGYAAANGERLSASKDWALELLPYHVRVNAIVVAECWTPQYKWWISQQEDPGKELQAIVSKIPLENRMTTCEEIADMVLFLLSPNAGSMTGQFLFVDGGYVFLDRAIKPNVTV